MIFYNVKHENHDYRKFVKKKGECKQLFSNFYVQSIHTQIIIGKMKSSGLEKLKKKLERLKKA